MRGLGRARAPVRGFGGGFFRFCFNCLGIRRLVSSLLFFDFSSPILSTLLLFFCRDGRTDLASVRLLCFVSAVNCIYVDTMDNSRLPNRFDIYGIS